MDKYIYIVRHGTTEACENGKSSGESNDVFLNQKGIDQIKKTVKSLLSSNIQYIYTSNFKRTIQTSNIIKEGINQNCSINLDHRLSNKDNFNEYQQNIKSFLQELIDLSYNEGNFCLVTHGKIIKLIYYYTLNNYFPDDTPKVKWCDYGCVSCLKIQDNKLIPIYFGKK
jgi:broad specificity phosphatase PhoE